MLENSFYFLGAPTPASPSTPRASSPLLVNHETIGSPSQVCVVLQPPLPSLAGSRSSSPNQKGSLSDMAQTPPASMPIILAPSPLSRPPIAQGTEIDSPEDEGQISLAEPVTNTIEEAASESVDKASDIRDV